MKNFINKYQNEMIATVIVVLVFLFGSLTGAILTHRHAYPLLDVTVAEEEPVITDENEMFEDEDEGYSWVDTDLQIGRHADGRLYFYDWVTEGEPGHETVAYIEWTCDKSDEWAIGLWLIYREELYDWEDDMIYEVCEKLGIADRLPERD